MSSLVIGLTGSIGSGKSTVAEIIESCNIKVIKSDLNAKEIMHKNPKVKRNLIEAFGENVYLEDGNLNSTFIASLVFDDEDIEYKNLNRLNQIVHPIVIEQLMEDVEALESKGEKLIFVESALIYEADLQEGFDYVVVVNASKENVIERLTKSRGMTEKQIENVMKTQISNEEKVGIADFVIDNNSTTEKLKESVDFVISVFRSIE